MIQILTGVITRIISNSYINVFQKMLTKDGIKSSLVNFYTYLGLGLLSLFLLPFLSFTITKELTINFLITGFLGALGNYFIIKALSQGELSTLAPINSYKPIVALIIAYFYLGELPSLYSFIGIILIIYGTFFLYGVSADTPKKAVIYRVLALICSGTEAVFIKKLLLLSDIPTSFVLWVFAGLIFSSLFIIISQTKPVRVSVKKLFLLIFSVGIMQYSTNFVFSKINVSLALALFQLSTILSVFLGANIFHEKELPKKILASAVMIIGAIFIILFN